MQEAVGRWLLRQAGVQRTERPDRVRWLSRRGSTCWPSGIGLGCACGCARGCSARRRWMARRRFGGHPRRPMLWWGIAARCLWIAIGLWRLLAGTEKPTAYYLRATPSGPRWPCSPRSWCSSIRPIVTLGALAAASSAKGETPDLARRARAWPASSYVQAVLVVLMVLAATGDGARHRLSRLTRSTPAFRIRGSSRYAGNPSRNVSRK